MLERLIQLCRPAIAFDRNQSGAVALLCLAALMILFMTTLVLYDTGKVAFEKVQAQTGADVAAYSQAATKARSMNMIAYANISKRTLVGLHNMYWAMYEGWLAWTSSRCSKCSIWNPKACADCAYNGIMILVEGFLDWFWFSGLPIVPKVLWLPWSSSTGAFETQVSQINWWQAYMINFTPWWAWAEASIRGMRNGSSLIGSYPPLNSPVAVAMDWVDFVVSVFGGTPSGGTSWLYDMLPVANWNKIYSWPDQNKSPIVPNVFSLGIYTPHEGCSAPTLGFNVLTPASLAEFYSNYQHHRNRSDNGFWIASGPRKAASWGLGLLLAGFCFWRIPPIPWVGADVLYNNMAPFHLAARSNSPQDMSAKSNVIFSYRHAPKNRTRLRENYNYMPSWNYVSAGRPILEASSGSWTLSRGEIVFPQSKRPAATPNNWFGHHTWMWHPGWTAKLRPVALPGEQAAMGFTLANMLKDVSPFLWLSRNVLGLASSPGFSSADADADIAALNKALFAMDANSLNGLAK